MSNTNNYCFVYNYHCAGTNKNSSVANKEVLVEKKRSGVGEDMGEVVVKGVNIGEVVDF